MIGWLRGEVRHRSQSGNKNLVVLACGGVGYEIRMVQRSWSTVHVGQALELWVHHAVSPENLQLFGFTTIAERDLFRELISVSGVGPQAGLSILDACEINELITALVNGDIKTLCRAQGIGKRSAERLVLDLRSKFVSNETTQTNELAQVSSPERELFTTLESLGYETAEIRQALQRIEADRIVTPQDGADAWLRACIQQMTGAGP